MSTRSRLPTMIWGPFAISAGRLVARQAAVLERNIDPGTAGGMGSETKQVQNPQIAVGDLSEADRILQTQPMVAREPDMRRPFTPLRRRDAIEHDEGGLRMPHAQRPDQTQPEFELVGVDFAIFAPP